MILQAVAVLTVALLPLPLGASVTGRCDKNHGQASAGYAFPEGDLPGGGCHAAISSVAATVEVAATIAHVRTNLTYVNDLAHAIMDAVLLVSVPTSALLLSFGARVADMEPVTGEVRVIKKSDAPPVCQRDVSAHFGFYEAPPQPGAQRVPLGRVEPGASVVAQLEYVQELAAKWQPGVAAPALQLHLQAPTASRRKPAGVASSSPSHAVTVRISVETPAVRSLQGARVTSPTAGVQVDAVQAVDTSSPSSGATVKSKTMQDVMLEIQPFAGETGPASSIGMDMMQDDLQFTPEVLLERRRWLAQVDAKGEKQEIQTLAVAVALPAAVAAGDMSSYEVVLVLDRSNSMRGVRFSRVQKAARTFVQSLTGEVRFNLVGFGADSANAALLFQGGSRQLDESTFSAATSHIGAAEDFRTAQQRSLKSTDQSPGLVKALELVFSLPRDGGTQLRVLVLTDRHPSDADDALKYVGERCSSECRLSALGLGWGASPPFVEGLAKAGRGTSNFVAERGGATALERALISQLAEGLQPTVRDVTVQWDEAEECKIDATTIFGAGPVSLSAVAAAADSDDLVQSFVKQGGITEFKSVSLEPPNVGAGGRVLALAFLGAAKPHKDFGESGALSIRATVGGKAFDTKVNLSATWQGTAVHALCAGRLAESLAGTASSTAGDINAEQIRSLGLAYSIETKQTQWVVKAPVSTSPGESAEEKSKVQVTSAARCAAGPRGEGAYFPKSNSFSSLGAGSNAGQSQSKPALSVRHPMANTGKAGVVDSLSSATEAPVIAPKFGAQLSLLDFQKLGSTLSLRTSGFPQPKTFRWGNDDLGSGYGSRFGPALGSTSPADKDKKPAMTDVGHGVALRGGGLKRMPSYSVLDFAQLGASLAVGGTGGRYKSAWTGLLDDDAGFSTIPGEFGTTAPGSELSNGAFPSRSLSGQGWPGARLEDATKPGTRNAARLGNSFAAVGPGSAGFSSLPMGGSPQSSANVGPPFSPMGSKTSTSAGGGDRSTTSKSNDRPSPRPSLASQISVLDFANLGASLSLRKPPTPDYGRFGDRGYGYGMHRGSSLSTLDYLFLGSSLALGGLGLARKSMSVYGTQRLAGGFDDFDYWSESFGGGVSRLRRDKADGKREDSLSVRSFNKLSTSLSAMEAASQASANSAARVAKMLSVVDFANLGASIALRSLSRPREVKYPFGSSLGRSHGAGDDLGYSDGYLDPADPLRHSRETAGDPTAESWDSRGGLDARPPWGLRSGEMMPSAASSPSSWVAVRVAGDAVAPVLGVWRVGRTCHSTQETVRLLFQPPGAAASPTVWFYTAQGPLLDGGASPSASVAAGAAAMALGTGGSAVASAKLVAKVPAPPSKGKGAVHEIRLALQISHQCELSARLVKGSSGGSKSSSSKSSGKEFLAATALPGGADMLNDLFGAGGMRNDPFGAMDDPFGVLDEGREDFGDPFGTDRFGVADLTNSKANVAAGDSTVLGDRLREVLALRRAVSASGGVPLIGDLPLDARLETAASETGFGRETAYGGLASITGDDLESSRFHALIGTQRFDGAFDLQTKSADGVSVPHLSALTAAWSKGDSSAEPSEGAKEPADANSRLAAHTATALAILDLEHSSLRGSWSMLASKAERWLRDSGAAAAAGCGAPSECIAAADFAAGRWGAVAARRK